MSNVPQNSAEGKRPACHIQKGMAAMENPVALLIGANRDGFWVGGEKSGTFINLGPVTLDDKSLLLIYGVVVESAAHGLAIQPVREPNTPDISYAALVSIIDSSMESLMGLMNEAGGPPPRGISGNQILVEICELELAAKEGAA